MASDVEWMKGNNRGKANKREAAYHTGPGEARSM